MSLRWVAISVMVFASALNYLDRQLLAAAGPTIRTEFNLSNRDFALIISVFSIVYACSAPVAGYLIDRIGLVKGMAYSVFLWSLAGLSTGLSTSFAGLLSTRALLGVAEGAAQPGNGKANATYLLPSELALGTAFSQLGLSGGLLAAPLIVAFLGPRYGWRSAFMVSGALGFVWIPIWLWISAKAPKNADSVKPPETKLSELLGDRRLWGLVIGNGLIMSLYSLWSNWTTLYFVEARGLTQTDANQNFAWIPPFFATVGAFAGGALAFRLIRSGWSVRDARLRICWLGAAAALVTAAIPWMPSPILAAAAISVSFFCVNAISTNVYAMPIDFFGGRRAGLGVAALTSAYGLMQTFISPLIGEMVDRFGFSSVCVTFALLPTFGVAVLQWTSRARGRAAASV
ncbi:MAG: MFS transporter [Bryobacteraceae bacterium]